MASSGNFCTLNPLTQPNSGTFSEGNLLFTHTAGAWRTTAGTMCMTTGKWYWEAYQYEDLVGNGFPCGIYDMDSGLFIKQMAGDYPGQSTSTYGASYVCYTNSGTYSQKRHNGSTSDLTLSDGDSGDVWQCALDLDNGKIWFGKNNSWDNSANPALGSNESYSSIPSSTWVPITCSYNDSNSENYPQNFGQDSTFAGRISAGGNADENGFGDFKYAPPTGFLALCSGNLPISDDIDPAQTDDDFPKKQFGAYKYTGNSGTAVTVSTDFQADLIWIKSRDSSENHFLQDSSRGFGNSKSLSSSATGAEGYNGGAPSSSGAQNVGATSFQAYGADWSKSTDNMIAWCWKVNGGTTVTNTEGSLDSTVQANTKAGFSIVQTPNFSGSCTQGHGLDKAPEFVVHKLTASGNNWNVWHTGLSGAGYIVRLNSNVAELTASHFNSTAPTADVFSLGASLAGSGAGVAYCWHSVDGYSKFGKYEANGNSNGPFIYTGFRPRLLVIKNITSAPNNWMVFDTARETFNPIDQNLHWDTTDTEETSTDRQLDILSNGFKFRSENGTLNHPSGNTYIYMAWGDVPFKYNNTF